MIISHSSSSLASMHDWRRELISVMTLLRNSLGTEIEKVVSTLNSSAGQLFNRQKCMSLRSTSGYLPVNLTVISHRCRLS